MLKCLYKELPGGWIIYCKMNWEEQRSFQRDYKVNVNGVFYTVKRIEDKWIAFLAMNFDGFWEMDNGEGQLEVDGDLWGLIRTTKDQKKISEDLGSPCCKHQRLSRSSRTKLPKKPTEQINFITSPNKESTISIIQSFFFFLKFPTNSQPINTK